MSLDELRALAREQRATLEKAISRLHPKGSVPSPLDRAILASLADIRRDCYQTKRLLTVQAGPQVVETVEAFFSK
jgi:hypothetical protein